MTYRKTIQCKQFEDLDFRCIKIGQWVQNSSGQKGQYLGATKRGTVLIAWRCMSFKRHAMQVKCLRAFAKNN